MSSLSGPLLGTTLPISSLPSELAWNGVTEATSGVAASVLGSDCSSDERS